MGTKIIFILTLLGPCSFMGNTQVQVSQEPLHKKVLENKYIRLLDVWLRPGDTTLFHIHSTPSVFLYFSSNTIATQVEDGNWVKEKTVAGKSWYRAFSPDVLVHRVCNSDADPFHVIDVEILSSHETATKKIPLQFPVLYENEKVFAYNLAENFISNLIVSNRGPMVAGLVSGDTIHYVDNMTKQEIEIKPGGYYYIEPGTSFYFKKNGKANMVLFEIK